MGWFGKVMGGTIGFALGGPLGAIAGAAFGHVFDKSSEGGYAEEMPRMSSGEVFQFTFFVATFSMLAKLVRADGHISRQEIDSIEKFMAEELHLNAQSRRFAVNIFNTAVDSPDSFHDFAVQFYRQFHNRPQFLELMIDIMLRVSVADGNLSATEEDLILSAATVFNFSEAEYNRLKSRYIKDFDKYYAILGCDPNDSVVDIKTRYRKLVREYHPDTIAAKGLPEEFTHFANDKFREIQEAYEVIKKGRGIR